MLQARLSKAELEIEEKERCITEMHTKLKLANVELETQDIGNSDEGLNKPSGVSIITQELNSEPLGTSKPMANPDSGKEKSAVENFLLALETDPQPTGEATILAQPHAESTSHGVPPSSPFDDFSNLFPPTPRPQTQHSECSQKPKSRTPRALHNMADELGSPSERNPASASGSMHVSRKSERPKRTVPQVEAESAILPSRLLPPSERSTLDQTQGHELGKLRRPSVSALRRPALKDSKPDKRTTFAAGHDAETRLSKKPRNGVTPGIGSLISDLQSPRGSRVVAARARKLSKGTGRKVAG